MRLALGARIHTRALGARIHTRALGLLLLAGAASAAWAVVAWPHLNDVETGRTPEYPDLAPRSVTADLDRVTRALRQVLRELPRWELLAAGSGPAGAELRAVHATRVLRFKDDVTVRLRRAGGRTEIRVRSRSRVGRWDFGQNARNVRELLAALEARLRAQGP